MSEHDLSDLYPVAFCNDCGKLFTKVSRNICLECKQRESRLLNKVADHVKARPGSRLEDIVSELDIREEILLRFISEGLLRRFKLQMTYPCRLCHADITDGIICQNCSENLNQHITKLKTTLIDDSDSSGGLRHEYKSENNKPR